MVSREQKPAPRWFWIASIFLGFGLVDATQTVVVMRAEGMHHAWTRLFMTLLLSWLPWALATPLVLRLRRPYPPLQMQAFSAWLTHLALCAGINLVNAASFTGLEKLLNPWATSAAPGPFVDLWLNRFYNQILSSLVLYGCILLAGYMLDSHERFSRQQTETARLNEQLSTTQLRALRRQIEPHFLFNTLHGIAGLVREGNNDAAVNMIAALSDLFRRVVDDSNRQEVALEEEMEFLQRYLDVQKMRFADRLQLNVNVPRELYSAYVPSLILQPMVENAIKHGISKRSQGGAIRITASRIDGMLNLRVYNDGPRLPDDWENAHTGIGISNVRTRLQSLYGERFELSMRNQDPCGVEASVSVPFVSAPVVSVSCKES
jgi:two-component system, LytTR family, sensor kinase